MEQNPMVLAPLPHVLCMPFVCGKLAKNKFNQKNEKSRKKGQQSKETN